MDRERQISSIHFSIERWLHEMNLSISLTECHFSSTFPVPLVLWLSDRPFPTV
ncbi:hypothetical protein H6F93_10230 [Leptolyngbya sp. FACHB-671]|uniref:hypothetical protein n=1 Tax=Leptolyngbya sp. FACHB-671 TaxID=2692812 RepID=UPI0016899804|nr:hypothetical protein [Leptolyngbya sp. FACHB-671]MBD2067895.1 hypothetical protein [Leptolyngbya sp. FACHB-671]